MSEKPPPLKAADLNRLRDLLNKAFEAAFPNPDLKDEETNRFYTERIALRQKIAQGLREAPVEVEDYITRLHLTRKHPVPSAEEVPQPPQLEPDLGSVPVPPSAETKDEIPPAPVSVDENEVKTMVDESETTVLPMSERQEPVLTKEQRSAAARETAARIRKEKGSSLSGSKFFEAEDTHVESPAPTPSTTLLSDTVAPEMKPGDYFKAYGAVSKALKDTEKFPNGVPKDIQDRFDEIKKLPQKDGISKLRALRDEVLGAPATSEIVPSSIETLESPFRGAEDDIFFLGVLTSKINELIPDRTSPEYVAASAKLNDFLTEHDVARTPEEKIRVAEKIQAFMREIEATHPAAVTEASSQELLMKDAQGKLQIADEMEGFSKELKATLPEVEPSAMGKEGTRKEWIGRLKHLVGRTTDGLKESLGKKWEKAGNAIAALSKAVDEKISHQSVDVEKAFTTLGEKYGKLGFKSKVAIGAALGIGAGVSMAAVSLPGILVFSGGIAAQRIAGFSHEYLKRAKDAQTDREKALAMVYAGSYGIIMSGLMGVLAKEVAEDAPGIWRWIKDHVTHFDPMASPEAMQFDGAYMQPGYIEPEVQSPHVVIPEPLSQIPTPPELPAMETMNTPAEAANISAESIPADQTLSSDETIVGDAPKVDLPMIEAAPGHGYEWMAKRMWEQAQHFDPAQLKEQYGEDSDIYKLATTDAAHIDQFVHQLAADPEHGFYKPDGSSVRIDVGSHMSIDSDGDIQIGDAVEAPENAPETAPLPAISSSEVGVPDGTEELAKDQSYVPPLSEAADAKLDTSEISSIPEPAPLESIEEMHEPVESVDIDASNPPPLPVEHPDNFINANNLAINPSEGHIYQDGNGAMLAYGNSFEQRLAVAQEFAKNTPGASIWVQAEKPMLVSGEWHPWVFEVKNSNIGGFFNSAQIMMPLGEPDPKQIGAIIPDTFMRRVD